MSSQWDNFLLWRDPYWCREKSVARVETDLRSEINGDRLKEDLKGSIIFLYLNSCLDFPHFSKLPELISITFITDAISLNLGKQKFLIRRGTKPNAIISLWKKKFWMLPLKLCPWWHSSQTAHLKFQQLFIKFQLWPFF